MSERRAPPAPQAPDDPSRAAPPEVPPSASRGRPLRAAAPLLVAAAGAPFGETFVLRGASVADLALATACGLALMGRMSRPSWSRVHRPLLLAAFSLLGWVLLDAALVALLGPFVLSPVELARSLAKLLFYLGATLLLVSVAWKDRDASRFLRGPFLTVLALHAGVGVYGAVAASTEWGLPYRFLSAGTGRGEDATRIAHEGMAAVHRVRGVAAEPTYFGWFQATGLGLVLLKAAPRRRGLSMRVTLVVAAIVGSLSLVGIGLLVIAVGLVALSRRWPPGALVRCVAPGLVACAVLALLVPPERAAMATRLVDRVVALAAGRPDPSSSVHLVGSWELAAAVLRVSPWLGSALGNYDLALHEVGAAMSGDPTRAPEEIGWNAFAFIAGSLGALGLLLFVLLLGVVGRRDPWAGLLMAAAAWGNSTVLGAPFWVLFLLAGMWPASRQPARDAGEVLAAEEAA